MFIISSKFKYCSSWTRYKNRSGRFPERIDEVFMLKFLDNEVLFHYFSHLRFSPYRDNGGNDLREININMFVSKIKIDHI